MAAALVLTERESLILGDVLAFGKKIDAMKIPLTYSSLTEGEKKHYERHLIKGRRIQ